MEQESSLFKHRLSQLSAQEHAAFMARNGMEYALLSNEKKSEVKDKLIGLGGVTDLSFARTSFYCIPFQQAIRLLASRSVYLEAGYAFVPLEKLEAIILMRVSSSCRSCLLLTSSLLTFMNSSVATCLAHWRKQR
jgi:DNA primase large subunit